MGPGEVKESLLQRAISEVYVLQGGMGPSLKQGLRGGQELGERENKMEENPAGKDLVQE